MAVRVFAGSRWDSSDESLRTFARSAPPLVLLIVALVVVWNSFYTLGPHEKAVVLRFGKFYREAASGLNFKIPFADKPVRVAVNDQNVRFPMRRDAGEGTGRGGAATQSQEESLELTGDLNAAVVEWTVQWRVSDPKKFLFSITADHVNKTIEMAAQSVMHQLVGDYSVDEILTTKREEVGPAAHKATQAMLDGIKPGGGESGVGITIISLQMQRVTPPDQVKPAFDEVNKAIQDKDKLVNEANRERNQLIPRARANADKLVREAEGYADRRRAESLGEIAALLAKYHAYKEAPDVTRRRLYLEAMEDVLMSTGPKTVLDADLRGLVPLLELGGDGGGRGSTPSGSKGGR